ncbi:MAG TPA: hypothetical protein VK797_11790 [Tepidisphaeraceae bacterium]|nr:hypothetical protein [Tepidisphaeraceae bacterium]
MYAAHAILFFRFKETRQNYFPVWENVYLIEVADGEDPETKALQRARQDEGDSSGTLTYDGHPAELVFVGIRKIISVSHISQDDSLTSGDELTYSKFVVSDKTSLHRLARGEPTTVEYCE